MACQNGHLDVLNELLPYYKTVDIARPSDGITPLFIAAESGRLEVVEKLIENGADVNNLNIENGKTPLYVASQNGHVDIVCTLLRHGAIADYVANNGNTPYSIASLHSKHVVVNLLNYYIKPTAHHSLCMAMMLMEEIWVYYLLDCTSIIELFQMM